MRNIQFLLLLFIIIGLGSFTSQSRIIYVPGNYSSIQDAINAAVDGDTVLVAPATYFENINFRGKFFLVASHYILSNDPSFIAFKIINGSIPPNSDSVSCVIFNSVEDSTSILQGFTLQDGSGTKWMDPQYPQWIWRGGGGILIYQSSPTIKDNYVVGNIVTNMSGVNGAQGGGILSYGGNPFILNNLIMENQALYGCGVVMDYSGGRIKNNIIYANYGGEMYGGGGFWQIGNGAYPVVIENNHFIANVVTGSDTYGGRGGAMFVCYGTVTAINNLFWWNTQTQGGPIAQVDGGTSIVTFSNVEGGFPGVGNINLFSEFADSNFYPSNNSPLIDSGHPDSIYFDPEAQLLPGFAEWPSMGNLRNDIGAYVGPLRKVLCIFSITDISENKKNALPEDFKLEQNFPNPFNSNTRTNFSIRKIPGKL